MDLKIYSIIDVATTSDELIELQVIVVDGFVAAITVPVNDIPRHVLVESLDWIKVGDEVKDYRHILELAKGWIPFAGNIIEYDAATPYPDNPYRKK